MANAAWPAFSSASSILISSEEGNAAVNAGFERSQASKVVSICYVRPPEWKRGYFRQIVRSPVASPRPYEGLWREHATPSTSRTSLDPLLDPCSIVSSIDPLQRAYLLPLYHEKHTWMLLKPGSLDACDLLYRPTMSLFWERKRALRKWLETNKYRYMKRWNYSIRRIGEINWYFFRGEEKRLAGSPNRDYIQLSYPGRGQILSPWA